jgi:Mn-dependent DtxR family transcriptional regulator
MLSRILEEMRRTEQPISKAELSRKLDVDASALEGMLEQLANQGKLRRVKEMTIKECQEQVEKGVFKSGLCAFLTHGNSATYYEIPEG